MNSITFGVDFSMSSTAMCCKKHYLNKPTFEFFWFPRIEKKLKDKFKLSEILEIYPYETQLKKSDTFSEKQVNHVRNAVLLTSNIMKEIKRIVENFKDAEIKVCVEGFSFGSSGMSYIDLIVYQSIFREHVISDAIKLEVIPPTEVKKKFTGKGNANKELMCSTFTSLEIDNVKVNELQMKLKELSKLEKPFDDLIDSFAICNNF